MDGDSPYELFASAVQRDPHRRVLWPTRGDFITNAELSSVVDAAAAAITAEPGERVGVVAELSAHYFVTLLALWRCAAVPITLDAALDRDSAMRILDGCAATRLLCPAHLSSRHQVIGRPVIDYPVRSRSQAVRTSAPPARRAEDPCLIKVTTGSTGAHKAALFTNGQVLQSLSLLYGLGGRTRRSLLTLPSVGLADLLHGNECLLAPVQGGRVAEIPPAELVALLNDFGADRCVAAPAVWFGIAKYLTHSETTLSTLRTIATGGAPLHPEVASILAVRCPAAHIVNVYGATEALPMAAADAADTLPGDVPSQRANNRLGHPVPGVRLRLAAVDGVADIRYGEVTVSGKHVSTGYAHPHTADAATKVHAGGTIWHRTGDIGSVDARGRFYIHGRISDLVSTQDDVLFPFDLESILDTVPGVRRSAVINPAGNDCHVRIFVERLPEAGHAELHAAVTAAVRGGQYSLPDFSVTILERLPVDIRHNSKIRRDVLRDLTASDTTSPLDRKGVAR